MTTRTENFVEGTSVTLDAQGSTAVRVFILQDVPGNTDSKLWNATQDSRIPPYGDPHPVIPGLQVTQVVATPLSDRDNAHVRVEVTYSVPNISDDVPFDQDTTPEEKGVMSLSAALVTEETNFDRNGRPLLVQYTGTLVDSEGNQVEVDNDEQIATLEIPRVMPVVSFTRRETESPIDAVQSLVGTINSRSIGGFAEKTILLTRIDASSQDGGLTFDVTYEFQHNERGWTSTVAWIDPETDRPPTDVTSTNGLADYELYREADHHFLRLPFNITR